MAATTRNTSTAHKLCSSGSARVQAAQRRVYDAETTLHAARQSGIDSWVAAAYDRLHEAITEYAALDQLAA